MTLKPWLRRLLSFALIAAAFAFLLRRIILDFDAVREFEWELRPGLLILSLVALVLVLVAGVAYWGVLLRSFGLHPPLVPLARAWFLANLSRYIPGGAVWQLMSLAQFSGTTGLTPVVSITSLLVQMGFMLLAAGVVGVVLLPGSALGEAYPLVLQLRWGAPLVLLAVHPVVIGTLLRWMGKLSRKQTVAWQGGWRTGLWLLLLAVGLWVAYGAAFYLFLRSFVDLPLQALPTVTAIHALAWVVGYLAFFAPAGLGFKDAALTLLLAELMPPAVAASLAVLARLWTVAGEMLPALALLPPGVMRADPPADGDSAQPLPPPVDGQR